ncbi:MAG: lytic transglycosylase domain-containing protein [Rhodospirillales bacterium]|tara:strand:- start:61804 stop:62814 length:1011 start_codon:yes stop_codon:yes gene_type:complete
MNLNFYRKYSLFTLIVIGTFALSFNPVLAKNKSKLQLWLGELRSEALVKNISPSTFDRAFIGFAPIKRIIELDRKQPEFTMTFKKYLNHVIPKSRISKGKIKYRENRKLLDEIGRKYRVQPRFIVAFWGIESSFGKHFGGFPVVHSLATLAFDGRRSKFFRGELLRALRILNQGHISQTKMLGSWAGAMGNFQFMPSSFENFAVDYDGDGKRDIWSNKGDAFASAANYLKKSGWRSDQTWGREVILPKGFDKNLITKNVRKNITEWQSIGVRKIGGKDLPRINMSSYLVEAYNKRSEKSGKIYLVYNNYDVTLKWNRSTFFALAVGLLADKLKITD